jgi:hypothetical protein
LWHRILGYRITRVKFDRINDGTPLKSDSKSVVKLEFLVLFNGKGLDIGKIAVKKGGDSCGTLYLFAVLKLSSYFVP